MRFIYYKEYWHVIDFGVWYEGNPTHFITRRLKDAIEAAKTRNYEPRLRKL